MDEYLEAKLGELIDRQEIWQVMLDYARGIDRFDRDLVRSCYHEDAIDDHHGFGGTPDQFLDSAFSIHRDYQSITQHKLTNHNCQIEGDDAHAETYYLFMGVNLTPPHLVSMGRYIDHLQKRDGHWKIASRVCVIERNLAADDHPDYVVNLDHPRFGAVVPASRSKDDLSYMRPVRPRRMSADD